MNSNLPSQIVQSHLDKRDLNYRRETGETPGRSTFKMDFEYDEGELRVIILVDDVKGIVRCFSCVPLRIPKGQRAKIGEFLHRANYGLRFGGFEFDVTDGEVRYRTSLAVGDGVMTDEMIEYVIGPCIQTYYQYLPGICAVAFADVSVTEAVHKCEESDEDGNSDAQDTDDAGVTESEDDDTGETRVSEKFGDDCVPKGTTVH